MLLHVGLGMVVTTQAAWVLGELQGRPWHIGTQRSGQWATSNIAQSLRHNG